MKLFLRDHLDIILLYLFNSVLLSYAYHRLDGFQTTGGILYFLFLSLFLLLLLMVLRYVRKRKLYKALNRAPDSLEDMVETETTDAETNAFFRYNRKCYETYQRQMNDWKEENGRWQSHLMQWIHQMKTPVSVIRLMVQSDAKQIDTFGVLYELDRLQNQMDLMLGLARAGQVKNDLVIEEISLEELLQEVIRKNKRLFIQYQVFPRVEYADQALIHSDRKWLAFVMEQLLHNAVKYSSAGSGIEIHIKKEGSYVSLTIRDEGIGIRPRDLPRIFELYYTGSNGRENDQSSGIGLYLVKTVLDDLGHKIEIESEAGKGTVVSIVF